MNKGFWPGIYHPKPTTTGRHEVGSRVQGDAAAKSSGQRMVLWGVHCPRALEKSERSLAGARTKHEPPGGFMPLVVKVPRGAILVVPSTTAGSQSQIRSRWPHLKS